MSSSDDSPSALPQALAPVEPPVEVKAPPKEASKPSGRIIAAQAMKMEFSGPMPHPDLLGRYEQICPGSADRIIRMAEQEAEHRRSAERTIIDAQIVDMNKQHTESRRGQICALVITLAALAAGVYTAMAGHEVAGSIIGVGGIGGIVTTFILGRQTPSHQEPPQPEIQRQQPKKRRRK
jgi:uncharacterized membrane protein